MILIDEMGFMDPDKTMAGKDLFILFHGAGRKQDLLIGKIKTGIIAFSCNKNTG